LSDLRVREKDAREDAREAKEKVAALIKSTHVDAAKSEQLWMERDDLLQAIEGLHTEHDLAR